MLFFSNKKKKWDALGGYIAYKLIFIYYYFLMEE